MDRTIWHGKKDRGNGVQMNHLAVDSFLAQWNIWTQFLGSTITALRLDSLAESHPVEVTSLFANVPWPGPVAGKIVAFHTLCITFCKIIDATTLL